MVDFEKIPRMVVVEELRKKKQAGGRWEHWQLLLATSTRKVAEVEGGQIVASVSGAMRTVGPVVDPD